MSNFGRERTPEAEAEAIMNQSDESLDDLMEGTEVFEEADEDFEDGEEVEDLVDEMGDSEA